MTQSFRCLAAFALLVAFNAGAVRAEEEQKEVSPPPHTSVELLPAPYPVGTVVIPYAASCCQGCGSACACCSQCCARTTPADNTQYVVTTKIVHASPDGDCDEIMAPKITVFAGQMANVSAQDVEAVTGIHGGVGLMIRVMKQDKQVRLNLGVQEHTSINLGDGSKDAVEETRTVCNVTLGKTKRLVFTKHDNGSDASWAEVMVTAIPPEADAEDSPLDCVGEVVDALMDAASEVAMSLFGDAGEVQPGEFTSPVVAAPRDYPVQATAPCPAVKQCVAVEAVKKRTVHIRLDDKHGRTSLEVNDGEMNWKYWKYSADHITISDGCLTLEGNVLGESGDSSILAEKLSVKLDGLEIKIGD